MQHLDENMAALEVTLTADELSRIDHVVPPGAAAGTRHAAPQMQALGR